MKKLFTITIILLLTISAKAQKTHTCPEGFNAKKLLEFPTELDKLRPKLKILRQWARANNNTQAEVTTNKLEYWAKDIARYIRKYAESHTDKVCERIMETDYKYLSDFFILTIPLLEYQYPTNQKRFDAIDMTKYH